MHRLTSGFQREKQLVVFGGRVGKEGSTKGDTWMWDADTWREGSDASAGIRNHHSMAYDRSRERLASTAGLAA